MGQLRTKHTRPLRGSLTSREAAVLTWDDPSIVRALVDGEPGSWDYFVERYSGCVIGAVRRVLRGRGLRPSPADVDDISENVFVMLLEKDAALLRRYDPSYRLTAYLAVLAPRRRCTQRRPRHGTPAATTSER